MGTAQWHARWEKTRHALVVQLTGHATGFLRHTSFPKLRNLLQNSLKLLIAILKAGLMAVRVELGMAPPDRKLGCENPAQNVGENAQLALPHCERSDLSLNAITAQVPACQESSRNIPSTSNQFQS